jgi:hypothetical protein
MYVEMERKKNARNEQMPALGNERMGIKLKEVKALNSTGQVPIV